MKILSYRKKRIVVRSASDKRVHYILTKRGRKWACDCPAFIYQKGHRKPCKHILFAV